MVELAFEFAFPVKRPETVSWWRGLLAGGGFIVGGLTGHTATTARPHWAFQSVAVVAPPSVRQPSWGRNPVDRFILAKLEANGLQPASPASKEELIRRVTFALIGLPPTPEEVDGFVRDGSPDAYERLIDRLLASAGYGERWARHWLDLARYAESDGFEHDALRPHSWRYRDYVIKSFNDDKPYARFIREQIAGDELWPADPAAITATAFNLLGPDMVDSADQVQRRLNTLNDATDTSASVFLGLTLGCARCHDHKFEPFTQRDYFAMQAFFTPAMFQRELAIPTPSERAAHDAAMATYRQQADSAQKALEALEAPYRESLHEEKLSRLSEDARLAHNTPKEKRTMEQEGTVQETAPMLKFTDAELVKTMSANDQTRRETLLDALKKMAKPAPLPRTMALQNTNGPPPKAFVLIRGDYNNPGEEVQAGFPAVLRGSQREESQSQGKGSFSTPAADHHRAALAEWIASADNPLTARVMVNRLWQHHFGRGLVRTPSDFGTRGAPPTHPELLDWLAGEFAARGWSMKAMHKLILMSAAYQQSSAASAEALARDPENALFSRQNRVRLEGEAIRDSLLAISGQLNDDQGGASVSPPIPDDIIKISKNSTASADAADHARRSIYVLARRNLRFPFLEVFDAPDNNLTCPERGRSTTAPQALTLLNSDEVLNAARATAERLMKEMNSADARVERAFGLILGRPPTAKESVFAQAFVKASEVRQGEAEPDSGTPVAPSGLAELCRALFNLNAFVYVD